MTPPKKGDTGTVLYIKKDNAWWQVESEDADRENGWRDGPWGAYIPVANIVSGEGKVFPDYKLKDGAIVRLTAEVVRP